MNKNSLLNIANFFCQLFKFSIAISIIIITIIFIHFQLDRSSYSEWKFEEPKNDSIIHIETESYVSQKPQNEQIHYLSGWKIGSLYFNYLKITAILVFLYLSINQFRTVLKSVRKYETFHQTNVRAFKKIGSYCFLIFGLSIFSYWGFEDYSKSSISISLYILLIALIAFILAEIFKEGNNLQEENQLTI